MRDLLLKVKLHIVYLSFVIYLIPSCNDKTIEFDNIYGEWEYENKASNSNIRDRLIFNRDHTFTVTFYDGSNVLEEYSGNFALDTIQGLIVSQLSIHDNLDDSNDTDIQNEKIIIQELSPDRLVLVDKKGVALAYFRIE